ncbi:DUF3017 domain-containing protein [Dermacoccaceae bacterium W4C1]
MPPARLGPLWFALAAGVLAAFVLIAADHARTGGLVLAAALAAAALVRAVAPESMAHGLKVRSRALDVTFYLGAALVVVVLFTQVRWGGSA